MREGKTGLPNRVHEFVDRETGEARRERFYGDRVIRFLYSRFLEDSPTVFRIITSKKFSSLLGFLLFDTLIGEKITKTRRFMEIMGMDLNECLDPPESLDTLRKIFERRIRYWDFRPMPEDEDAIVSPSDSKMYIGSSSETKLLFVKEKFFDYKELLGQNKRAWVDAFHLCDFAVFRLTPEKYHYNHAPVSGVVLDFYGIEGAYHSCHPEVLISILSPYSKNRRFVTIIDTDTEGGTKAGLVAMIEVVALLVGGVVQCYSEFGYEKPQEIRKGMFLKKGQPKSLFKPGSSTVILLFQKGRVQFSSDILTNCGRHDVESVFSRRFGIPVVETEVKVRSLIARALNAA